MGRLLLFLLIFGVLAVPANAADLGELTPLSVRGSEDCGGPTGAPGELVVRTTTGVRFVTATRAGFQLGQALDLGKGFTCSAVKVRPSGAGVIAGQLDGRVVAVVRDPGGAWSAPLTIAEATDLGFAVQLTADVSDRGDAIVGLKVTRLDGIDVANPTSEFRVARRAPGGVFGASERIGEAATSIGAIVPGIAATGEAFVVTSRAPTNRRPPFRVPVDVRIAPPGGMFGVAVHVADTHLLSAPALAVAADGRALIAVPESDRIVVAERAPGTGFGTATPIGPAGEGAFATPSVALGAGGAAAVAWTRLLPTDVQVVTRSAPGTFSPPIVAVDAVEALPAGSDPFFLSESFFGSISPIGFFFSGLWTPLTITPDGRAVLAFKEGPRASLTSVPLAGGPVVTALTGNGFDTSADAAALVLADGTPAVAWTQSAGGRFEGLTGAGVPYHVHLATEGVIERPDPPAPRVTVGAPATRVVGDRGLRLPIACSAACEVTASLGTGDTVVADSVQMTRAGRRTLRIDEAALAAPERLGPVRIRLSYSTPGALHEVERTVTVRLVRAAGFKLPDVTAVRARRVGDRIRVTFRVSNATGEIVFVSGDDTRGWSGEPLQTRALTAKPGDHEYSVSLPAKGVRFVTVRPSFSSKSPRTVVAVRG